MATPVPIEQREQIEHAGHLQAGRFHKDRCFYAIRAAGLTPLAPLAPCHLCDKGFPIHIGGGANEMHYGTQSLGMIPNTDCWAGYSELDQWLYEPLSWYCMCVLNPGEDFAIGADEEHKRMFLFLCSEALYGDNSDPVLLADCMQLAVKD